MTHYVYHIPIWRQTRYHIHRHFSVNRLTYKITRCQVQNKKITLAPVQIITVTPTGCGIVFINSSIARNLTHCMIRLYLIHFSIHFLKCTELNSHRFFLKRPQFIMNWTTSYLQLPKHLSTLHTIVIIVPHLF